MCSFQPFIMYTTSNNGHFNIPDKTAIIIMMEQPTSDEKFYRLSCCIDRFHFERLANTILLHCIVFNVENTFYLYTNTKGLYTDKSLNRKENRRSKQTA